MKTNHRNLIFPARYFSAPEFRAANTTCGTAYSGPEQRQRPARYFLDDNVPQRANARKRQFVALAN